jgi:hypothetical protein
MTPINKIPQRFRRNDLYEREADKLDHFDESGNISNEDRILKDGFQKANEDDVPHLHRPAGQKADHADRASFVSHLHSFRLQDPGSHGVVVVEGVLEEDHVAGQLDDGKKGSKGCQVENDVLTEKVTFGCV